MYQMSFGGWYIHELPPSPLPSPLPFFWLATTIEKNSAKLLPTERFVQTLPPKNEPANPKF